MITKNYQRVQMEKEKLDHLKSVFSSFFAETNPSALNIHIKPEHFFKVEKSFKSSALDPNKSNMTVMSQAPEPEEIQLQYRDKGGDLWCYSTTMPSPKDALGIEYEFGFSSGNMKRIGHNTMLIPRTDDELLYVLYYYSNLFTNSHESVPKNGNEKYFFFIPEVQQQNIKSTRIKESKIIAEVGGYNADELKRILTGLFAPVSNDENTNFNTLVEYLMKANEDQKGIYESLKKSVKSPKIDLGTPADILDEGSTEVVSKTIGEYIQEWIEGEKLLLVSEVSEEFPKKGWYQKPPKDDPNADHSKFLKTPIPIKFIEESAEQRFELAEQLGNNTELFNKLKKRW